ncbi:MAG: zinc-binding dehydrogenase, partial [Candidatus Hydrogenedentes bacterium]|nr:zinc-binding dehydrogenase [Candidatus Hydrogenedentota bacterium]
WLTDGALEIVVNHVLPLERAAEAQQLIAERKTTGKVVLRVED